MDDASEAGVQVQGLRSAGVRPERGEILMFWCCGVGGHRLDEQPFHLFRFSGARDLIIV